MSVTHYFFSLTTDSLVCIRVTTSAIALITFCLYHLRAFSSGYFSGRIFFSSWWSSIFGMTVTGTIKPALSDTSGRIGSDGRIGRCGRTSVGIDVLSLLQKSHDTPFVEDFFTSPRTSIPDRDSLGGVSGRFRALAFWTFFNMTHRREVEWGSVSILCVETPPYIIIVSHLVTLTSWRRIRVVSLPINFANRITSPGKVSSVGCCASRAAICDLAGVRL